MVANVSIFKSSTDLKQIIIHVKSVRRLASGPATVGVHLISIRQACLDDSASVVDPDPHM